ncbi:hypothetical protein FACS1894202_04140 [Clostridia bacterium]|nr:hypothetical protein FACS1894202_04140 [Clostridia bacterium]
MKEIIVYYSHGGNTRDYTEKLASRSGAELCEVHEKSGRNALTAFCPGCLQAMGGKASKIEPLEVDLSAYDKIMLAAPVWAGHPAPAINAVAELLPPGKQVGVILNSASGEGNADKLSDLIRSRGCEVVGVLNIKKGE